MGVLAWIITGLVAGALAGVVTGGPRRGCIGTLIIGVLGGLIGGALFNAVSESGESSVDDLDIGSIVVAFLGASLLLLVLQAITRD